MKKKSGGKHCEKRRNCLLQAISPFLTMFSYRCISLVHQNAAWCGDASISLWQLMINNPYNKIYSSLYAKQYLDTDCVGKQPVA